MVDVLHQMIDLSLHAARIIDQHRGAHALLVHESLVEPSVLSHIESLV